VLATSAAGPSGYPAVASATTQAAAPTAPSAPTNLTATVVSSTQVKPELDSAEQWQHADGLSAGALPREPGARRLRALPAPTGTSYSDSGLTASTSYSYRVLATSAAGPSGYSAVASATTQAAAPTAPSAPTNLTATAAFEHAGEPELDTPSSGSTPTGYQLERCQGAGCTTFAALPAPTGTSYSDMG